MESITATVLIKTKKILLHMTLLVCDGVGGSISSDPICNGIQELIYYC